MAGNTSVAERLEIDSSIAEMPAAKVIEIPRVKYKEKPVYDVLKRIMDICCSLFAIVVLAIPMLLVALLIFLCDFGNPIFTQERVGKDGKLFKIYKFRSMVKNAEQLRHSKELEQNNETDGPTFKIKDDPRLLRAGKKFQLGKIIRKTSLDELPQLFNILKGDMSVIGPRPFIPEEQERLPKERLYVKPGLSCYWQIGGKNSLPLDEQNALDFKYVEERSIAVDIKIIFKTIAMVLKSSNC